MFTKSVATYLYSPRRNISLTIWSQNKCSIGGVSFYSFQWFFTISLDKKAHSLSEIDLILDSFSYTIKYITNMTPSEINGL